MSVLQKPSGTEVTELSTLSFQKKGRRVEVHTYADMDICEVNIRFLAVSL